MGTSRPPIWKGPALPLALTGGFVAPIRCERVQRSMPKDTRGSRQSEIATDNARYQAVSHNAVSWERHAVLRRGAGVLPKWKVVKKVTSGLRPSGQDRRSNPTANAWVSQLSWWRYFNLGTGALGRDDAKLDHARRVARSRGQRSVRPTANPLLPRHRTTLLPMRPSACLMELLRVGVYSAPSGRIWVRRKARRCRFRSRRRLAEFRSV